MKKKIFFQIYLVTILVLPVFGQNEEAGTESAILLATQKNFGLFEDDKLLEISLRFPLKTYLRTKPKEDYLKANITFHLSKTDSITKNSKRVMIVYLDGFFDMLDGKEYFIGILLNSCKKL